MRIFVLLVSLAMAIGCLGSEPQIPRTNAERPSDSDRARSQQAESLEFDSVVDDQLADFVLDREAELSEVQERGADVRRSRSRVIKPGPQRRAMSARRFRKETQKAGLQTAVAHVEAVRRGTAQPDAKLVANAISEAVAAAPDQDIAKAVFMVFRASIQQTNADKRYFLSKLQRSNEVSTRLAEYLKLLNDAIASGGDCGGDDFDVREVDTSLLERDLRMQADQILERRAWVENSAGMERTFHEVQKIADEATRRRQKWNTAFQNYDQKSSQLFNLLSSVMKAMNEMRMGTVRNML